MDNVVLKNSVQSHITYQKTKLNVIKLIEEIPEYSTLKLDPEITLYVCNAVKNEVKTGDKIIDQKELTVSILTQLFRLSPDEIIALQKQILYFEEQ